jgi:hypothetical protein
MKHFILNSIAKYTFLGILSIMIGLSLSSCSKKITFLVSAVVPAARGSIEIKKDNNKNYVIHVHLSDLAEVSRLTPPKLTYVVWMVTDLNETKNVGQIKSETKMISRKLKASFETVSAAKPIQIFITAEDDGNVQYPGEVVVLTTEKF